jgi:Api92-like protein with ferredoxin domain
MPNHCNNVLTVVGDEETVDAFVDKVNGPGPKYPVQFEGDKLDEPKISVFSFHQLVPIPDDVQKNQYGDGGYRSGYNVERELWGVKWGAYDEELVRHEDNYAEYRFTTAWSPPEVLLLKASELFPSLTFYLSYSEESPSRGRFVVKNGELVDQTHDSYPFNEERPDYDSAMADGLTEDEYYEQCNAINEKYIRAHTYWVAENSGV